MKKRVLLALTLILFLGAAAKVDKRVVGSEQSGSRQEVEYPDSERTTRQYVEALKDIHIKNDPKGGVAILESILATDSSAVAAANKLIPFVASADKQRALDLAQRVYRSDSLNPLFALQYARLLLFAQQYDQAEAMYWRYLAMDDKEPDAYSTLALLLEQRGRSDEAIAVLDSADVQFGKLEPFSKLKTQIFVRQNRMDEAVAETEEMVRHEPYNPQPLLLLGSLYQMQRRDSVAIELSQRAFALDSTNVYAIVDLGALYKRAKQIDRYIEFTKRFVRNPKANVQSKIEVVDLLIDDYRNGIVTHANLFDVMSTMALTNAQEPDVVEKYGAFLVGNRLFDQAVEYYTLHLSDSTARSSYYDMIANLELYASRTDSAAQYIERGIAQFPDDMSLRLKRAHIMVFRREYKQAQAQFREVLKRAKTDSLRGEVWGYIGDTHQATGNIRKSYTAYEKSLRYNASNPLVLNNYAYSLADRDTKIDRAVAMSQRAVELSEQNNPTYLDTYAWALYRAGDYERAKKIMQRALSFGEGQDATIYLHYGDILAALGEEFIAKTYWEKAQEAGVAAEEIERRIQKQGDNRKR